MLIGFGTSIKDGGITVAAAFPDPQELAPTPAPESEGRRVKLGGDKKPVVTIDDSAVKPEDAIK